MAEIKLSNGMVALVDAADAQVLSRIIWVPQFDKKKGGTRVYAVGWDKTIKRSVFMHRLLMGAVHGQVVDHANGNALDNQRSNLRFATRSQNAVNRKTIPGPSGYRGVQNDAGRWRANIKVNGRMRTCGAASTPVEAAMLYDLAAIEHFGEFAVLNFPRVQHPDSPSASERAQAAPALHKPRNPDRSNTHREGR